MTIGYSFSVKRKFISMNICFNMKLIILVLCAISSSLTYGFLFDGAFVTPIDHFRPTDGRVVQFNYKVNVDNYVPGGPLFFYISDAGQFTTEWIESGLIVDLAMELGGAVFTTNLRYFRDNLPTESASLANLEHLTLEQILSDIAVFIHTAQLHLDDDSGKVFVWGTGLGATLAILARQKFPNLIDGAWSSNGLFLPIVFSEMVYLTIADNIREVGSDECGESVSEAFRQIEQLISNGDDETLIEEFGICRPFNITNNMDVGMFSEGVVDQIAGQFERFHHSGVRSFCEAMSVIPSDPMRSLSRWVRFTHNVDVGSCSNYDYAGRIQWTSDTEWHNPGTATGLRQFLYLQCTQLGAFRITTSSGMFGNRITEEYRQRMCEDSFGADYDFEQLYRNVEYLNILHGGQNPRVTRSFYTNGYLDQWIFHGITQTYEPNSYVVNVPGYSRWSDLTSTNTLDSIVLYNAKMSVVNAFREWVRD